jgi:hypothetical protein
LSFGINKPYIQMLLLLLYAWLRAERDMAWLGEQISSSYGSTGHWSSSDPVSPSSRSRFARHPIHRHERKASLPPDPDGPSRFTKRHCPVLGGAPRSRRQK